MQMCFLFHNTFGVYIYLSKNELNTAHANDIARD